VVLMSAKSIETERTEQVRVTLSTLGCMSIVVHAVTGACEKAHHHRDSDRSIDRSVPLLLLLHESQVSSPCLPKMQTGADIT
jgi:hypothetical protein